MAGSLDAMTVTLSDVTVASMTSDILLVAPHGESVILESDVGSDVQGATWTYNDELGTAQSSGATGTYKPTNVDGGSGNSDSFMAPAPTSGYGDLLNDLTGPSPNGTWKLYVRDDGGQLKSIGGWSLQLHTNPDVSPASKDFGSVVVGSTSAATTFTVTNTGANPLNLTAAQVQGADAGDFTIPSNDCAGTTVASGASCTLQAAFKPGSPGAKSAALVLTDDSGGSPHSLPLSGTGTQPAISITPAALAFGESPFGSTPHQFVTITNTGTAPLTVSLPTAPSSNDFTLSIQDVQAPDSACPGPGQLNPGQSCKFEVFFTPLTVGDKTATVAIADNAPGSPHSVTLTGTATALPVQPAQPVETGSPDIKLQNVSFSSPPMVGEPTTLDITASDEKASITGVIIDFGETLGQYGESACVAGSNSGNSAEFRIPYEFLEPGTHTISVTIFAGGCGTATAHTYVFTVDVAPATAARNSAAYRRAHSASTLGGPSIKSKCKDAKLLPTAKVAKRIAEATLCVMNEQRKLFKLKPLKLSKKLGKAALLHTRSMILGRFFAHQGPKELALVTRLKKVKYRGSAGENIGAGAGPLGTPVAMVNGWMHSTMHRANLLSKKWKAVGIGFLPLYPLKTRARPVATYTTDFGPKP
ncbi:MAG: hypothetical protein QOJ29_482 [Thermoleophilaceae bacterium]|nr:hypothetical protein [Thermoleophilaceae bacterium]